MLITDLYREVKPDDLKGSKQCHFFAGIGGWSIASDLRCGLTTDLFGQEAAPASHSVRRANKKAKQTSAICGRCGSALSVKSEPPVVFGEQVLAAIRHGWWDDVSNDLEGSGYATRRNQAS